MTAPDRLVVWLRETLDATWCDAEADRTQIAVLEYELSPSPTRPQPSSSGSAAYSATPRNPTASDHHLGTLGTTPSPHPGGPP